MNNFINGILLKNWLNFNYLKLDCVYTANGHMHPQCNFLLNNILIVMGNTIILMDI